MFSSASRGDTLGLLVAYGIIVLAVLGIAYVAMTALNGVAMWFSCRWLRLPPIGFRSTFQASALANLVLWIFGVSLLIAGFYQAIIEDHQLQQMQWMGVVTRGGRWGGFGDLFSPMLLFCVWIGAILTHATIYTQVCQTEDGTRLTYGQAGALSMVTLAFDGLCVVPVSTMLVFVLAWLQR